MSNDSGRSVTITIGKKDYRITYDHNAMSDLEDEAGLGVGQLFKREMGFSSTRLLLWAGMKRVEPGITLQRAGQLLDIYTRPIEERGNGGSLEAISADLMRAVVRSKLFKGLSEKDLASDEGDEIEVPDDADAGDDSGEARANASESQ